MHDEGFQMMAWRYYIASQNAQFHDSSHSCRPLYYKA